MNRREQDAHEDLCRRLVTALNERDAARAELTAAAQYFVAPDADGDLTIWRDRGNWDPVAVITRVRSTCEAFDLAARGLEVRP